MLDLKYLFTRGGGGGSARLTRKKGDFSTFMLNASWFRTGHFGPKDYGW